MNLHDWLLPICLQLPFSPSLPNPRQLLLPTATPFKFFAPLTPLPMTIFQCRGKKYCYMNAIRIRITSHFATVLSVIERKWFPFLLSWHVKSRYMCERWLLEWWVHKYMTLNVLCVWIYRPNLYSGHHISWPLYIFNNFLDRKGNALQFLWLLWHVLVLNNQKFGCPRPKTFSLAIFLWKNICCARLLTIYVWKNPITLIPLSLKVTVSWRILCRFSQNFTALSWKLLF